MKTGELTFNIQLFSPERAPVPVLHNQPMHARGTMLLIKCFHVMEKKVITSLNLGWLHETSSKLEYHDILILYYSLLVLLFYCTVTQNNVATRMHEHSLCTSLCSTPSLFFVSRNDLNCSALRTRVQIRL